MLRRSGEETLPDLRAGNHAGFFPAKPAIPVSGDDTVKKITDEFRDYDKGVEQFPPAIQVSANSQHGRGMGPYLPLFQKYHGLIGDGACLFGRQNIAGSLSLERSESQPVFPVVPDRKSYPVIAEMANPVEEYQGFWPFIRYGEFHVSNPFRKGCYFRI